VGAIEALLGSVRGVKKARRRPTEEAPIRTTRAWRCARGVASGAVGRGSVDLALGYR
jgi:hypothetical protein